ncbi:MAG: MBOAT family protein [Lachnospiraceae bacterium]|nr:MBOAT family protein [Lachnospiraceae bacterium]
MQIVSFTFLGFFLIVVLGVHVIPGRFRHVWLFAASIFFYFTQGAAHTVFLLFSILSTWIGGMLLTRFAENAARKKAVLAGILVCNFLVLAYFKYIGFFSGGRLTSPILPVGISFYLFQSAGYLIDVYRGTVPAERDPLRYGLFVSFFPTVLSGPIERGAHLLPQLQTEFLREVRFDTLRIRDGLVRMLWGYFCKMVLADRLAVAVDAVYAAPGAHGGAVLFLASACYTLQIYLDFAGYSSIAIGIAKCLGIEVAENFNAPYLAKSIGDFWRRWHISLSTWFRDYLYIPLGGNRKGQARKLLNLMIVFLVSGLWHGAGWNFILWGALHGIYQVIGILLLPFRKVLRRTLFRDESGEKAPCLVIRIVWTFLLVNLAWIFFRMGSLAGAFRVIAGFARPGWAEFFSGTLLSLGLNLPEWRLLAAGLAVVLISDLCSLKDIRISRIIADSPLPLRWAVYIAGVLIVLICGVWGPGYDASSFIYYRF